MENTKKVTQLTVADGYG